MAIIKCPECSTEVSDKAETCPKCAFPVADHFNPSPKNRVQTVEQTGKRHKLQMLLSGLTIIIGIIMLVSQVSAAAPSEDTIMWGFLICIVGVIWLVIVKILSWWYHG